MPSAGEDKRVLITPRDQAVTIWVAEQGAAAADTVGALAERIGGRRIGERTRRHLVARLAAAGLVGAQQLLAGQPAVVWPTKAGLELADLKGRGLPPALGTLTHQLQISSLRLEYEVRGFTWLSERRLLAAGHTGHLPDGLATGPDGTAAAVEVERTQKSVQRLDEICEELATRWPSTHYWAATDCIKAVQAAISRLPEDLRGRLIVRDLMSVTR